MKIACISDLHIPEDEITEYINVINTICKEEQIEILLIAGDIFEDYDTVESIINKLNQSDYTTYFVPGNHDLWTKNSLQSSEEIYEKYINNQYCVLNKTISLNEQYNLIGHIAWYDYTLADNHKYSKTKFDEMTIDNRTWNDKKYSTFTKDNIAKCRLFNQEISELIKRDNKEKILMTHMISHPDFIVKDDPKRGNIDYFSAFCGGEKLYELSKDPTVKYAICGHVHYRMRIIEESTEYICPCLGSRREWSYNISISNINKNITDRVLYANIKDSLQLINI